MKLCNATSEKPSHPPRSNVPTWLLSRGMRSRQMIIAVGMKAYNQCSIEPMALYNTPSMRNSFGQYVLSFIIAKKITVQFVMTRRNEMVYKQEANIQRQIGWKGKIWIIFLMNYTLMQALWVFRRLSCITYNVHYWNCGWSWWVARDSRT